MNTLLLDVKVQFKFQFINTLHKKNKLNYILLNVFIQQKSIN